MVLGKKDKEYISGLECEIKELREQLSHQKHLYQCSEGQADRFLSRIRVLEELVQALQLKAGCFLNDVKQLVNEANGQKGG